LRTRLRFRLTAPAENRIIIDEAHNILSTESFREAESWKDYRLETFEEIIKEGRMFGVFVTIASQRPNDISPVLVSLRWAARVHARRSQRGCQRFAIA
jgi:DNA helicase HerA-like ATPase